MASVTQPSGPEIPDNHRESWLALLSAAEAYCQKSGCDLAILTACKKFPSADGHRKRESGAAFPKECDFSYSVWGQGFLAESARRYVDDISVLHSTTMLMAQKHTRQAQEGGTKVAAEPGTEPAHLSVSGGGETGGPRGAEGPREASRGHAASEHPSNILQVSCCRLPDPVFY